jgi:hypothetical protein
MSRTFDAEHAENLEDVEKQFAVKAVVHAQTYWNLLTKVSGSSLRLTKMDDDIYEHLLKEFPEFEDIKYGEVIDEDVMKSVSGKVRWRKFMNFYEGKVTDFNFGTLLRADSHKEYSEENTIFVPRMQFYAIEIFRNKKGLNDWIKGSQ